MQGMGAAGGGVLQAALRRRQQGQLRHLRGLRGEGLEPAERTRPAGLHPAAQVLQRPVRRAAAQRCSPSGKHLAEIVHFGDQQVFDGATTYTCLLFLDRSACSACAVAKVDNLGDWRNSGQALQGIVPAEAISASEWNLNIGPGSGLFEKLGNVPTRLADVATRIFQGFKTGADPVFILDVEQGRTFFSNHLGKSVKLERSYLRPLFKSGQIKRYHLFDAERVILFPYRNGHCSSGQRSNPRLPKPLRICVCADTSLTRERVDVGLARDGTAIAEPKHSKLWKAPRFLRLTSIYRPASVLIGMGQRVFQAVRRADTASSRPGTIRSMCWAF